MTIWWWTWRKRALAAEALVENLRQTVIACAVGRRYISEQNHRLFNDLAAVNTALQAARAQIEQMSRR